MINSPNATPNSPEQDKPLSPGFKQLEQCIVSLSEKEYPDNLTIVQQKELKETLAEFMTDLVSDKAEGRSDGETSEIRKTVYELLSIEQLMSSVSSANKLKVGVKNKYNALSTAKQDINNPNSNIDTTKRNFKLGIEAFINNVRQTIAYQTIIQTQRNTLEENKDSVFKNEEVTTEEFIKPESILDLSSKLVGIAENKEIQPIESGITKLSEELTHNTEIINNSILNQASLDKLKGHIKELEKIREQIRPDTSRDALDIIFNKFYVIGGELLHVLK